MGSGLGIKQALLKGSLIASILGVLVLTAWILADALKGNGAINRAHAATQVSHSDPAPPALLAQARQLIDQGQIFAPAGANAVESYLRARQEPALERAAEVALWELLPLLDTGAGQAAQSGDAQELERLKTLIAAIDPNHLTLALRDIEPVVPAQSLPLAQAAPPTKMSDSPRAASVAASLEPTVDLDTATQAPSASPESNRVAANDASPTVSLVERRREPANPSTETDHAVASSSKEISNTRVSTASSPAANAVSARAPRLLRDAQVRYPTQALQRRLNGWVDVEFTVSPDGRATDVRVVAAEPANVFNREAINAASKWRFEETPAPYSGMKRRIKFNLPG
jgi:protein TonB